MILCAPAAAETASTEQQCNYYALTLLGALVDWLTDCAVVVCWFDALRETEKQQRSKIVGAGSIGLCGMLCGGRDLWFGCTFSESTQM